MHITASVFINDDESGLHKDYAKWLEPLAPFDASPERYAHNRTGEDNADAHMKRQIMGREVVVAITKGSSTSARGSRSSTASSTASATSGCWSRSSATEHARKHGITEHDVLETKGIVFLCFVILCQVQSGSDAAR